MTRVDRPPAEEETTFVDNQGDLWMKVVGEDADVWVIVSRHGEVFLPAAPDREHFNLQPTTVEISW